MKRTLCFLLAAIMALALVGCGGSSSNSDSNDTAVESPETTGNESSEKPTESASQADTSTSVEPQETATAPYDVELAPGAYWVGLHIPEGVYNVQVVSGIANLTTQSGVVAALGSGAATDYGDTYSNLTLANGDVLKLTQSLTVKISTQEAYFSTLSTYANPATETKELTAGTYTIGKDIPVGLYDISVVEGTTVNVSLSDYTFTAMLSADASIAESAGSSYKNLELLEGKTLQVSSGTVKLTPAEVMESPTPQK